MKKNFAELKKISKQVRRDMMQAIRPKESHHIGCSYSIVEILTYLYYRVLHVDPKQPTNSDRDIFILSKGHAGLALYTVLYERGFFTKEVLLSYDKDGGILPEHSSRVAPGIEISTGSLGHGLPIGIGFATSFLNDKKNNKVYVLMSDGELNEGSNWEAIMYAAHHKIHNLTVIVDNNHFQGYGSTEEVLDLSPLPQKIRDFHWNVYEANGHDFESLDKVFTQKAKTKNSSPHFIIAKTVKGWGLPGFEGKFEAHYISLDEETKKQLLESL
ncbi:transketolase [Candidatus Roizmanbacteria bacterium]|nr:transketolase [Candidatus Roizmanbacteria bacterium]